MVIWLVGLSGSGKTTIGRRLVEQWREHAPNTLLVDGDDIRALYRHNQVENAHAIEGRRVNAERITELCAWLDRQGMNVVCSILSIFPELRAENKNLFSSYAEVFIDVPIDVLSDRDDKGIYGPALRGETHNVVGLDIPFPKPDVPDLVIANDFKTDPTVYAAEILRTIVGK